jgi:dTDP-4-dehydrorhamnose reductase
MRILITGSNGLLGQKLVTYFQTRQIDFVATSKGTNRNEDCPDESYFPLDITQLAEVTRVFDRTNPTHVIHTAAITNVDYCELNEHECREVNVQASAYLFEACAARNIHFQLVSTDFVFDGVTGNYSEMDTPAPISIYGQSKLDAETILTASNYSNWSIVRTIIVYGNGNNLSRSNLILWAKDALQNGTSINVIDDQFRAPTFVEDLAEACAEIVLRDKLGIFHISGPETLSIYTILERIANHFHYSMKNVKRISSAELNQPAKRPPKTGFDLTKAKEELDYNPKTLEESLGLLFK